MDITDEGEDEIAYISKYKKPVEVTKDTARLIADLLGTDQFILSYIDNTHIRFIGGTMSDQERTYLARHVAVYADSFVRKNLFGH